MVLFLLIACDSRCAGSYGTDTWHDLEGPLFRVNDALDPQVAGEDVLLDAVARDGSDVQRVSLLYRGETSAAWHEVPMTFVGGDQMNGYYVQAVIPGPEVRSAGVNWYLEAADDSDAANVACSPENCGEDSYHFAIIDGS